MKLKIRALLKGPAKMQKIIIKQNWLISCLKNPAGIEHV